jgi:hypothetical protein
LQNDFDNNLDKLRSLRESAYRHIWRDLHNEWLPRLRDEIGFDKQFTRLIRRALRNEKFGYLLDKATDLAIRGIPPGVGAVVGGALAAGASKSGIHLSGSNVWPGLSGAGIGAGIGGLASSVLKDKKDNTRKQVEGLVLFYQSAKRIIK